MIAFNCLSCYVLLSNRNFSAAADRFMECLSRMDAFCYVFKSKVFNTDQERSMKSGVEQAEKHLSSCDFRTESIDSINDTLLRCEETLNDIPMDGSQQWVFDTVLDSGPCEMCEFIKEIVGLDIVTEEVHQEATLAGACAIVFANAKDSIREEFAGSDSPEIREIAESALEILP